MFEFNTCDIVDKLFKIIHLFSRHAPCRVLVSAHGACALNIGTLSKCLSIRIACKGMNEQRREKYKRAFPPFMPLLYNESLLLADQPERNAWRIDGIIGEAGDIFAHAKGAGGLVKHDVRPFMLHQIGQLFV